MISVLSCYCSLVFTLLSRVIHYTKSTLNSAPFCCFLNQIYLSLCSTQKLMKKMALIVNIQGINQCFIVFFFKKRDICLYTWTYIRRSLLKYTICSPQPESPAPHPSLSTLICLLLSYEKCSNNEWLLFTEVISCYISIIAWICLASQTPLMSLQWTFKEIQLAQDVYMAMLIIGTSLISDILYHSFTMCKWASLNSLRLINHWKTAWSFSSLSVHVGLPAAYLQHWRKIMPRLKLGQSFITVFLHDTIVYLQYEYDSLITSFYVCATCKSGRWWISAAPTSWDFYWGAEEKWLH